MHAFPFAAHPMTAGGFPVPGVPMVPNPTHPFSVTPSLTQYPTAPPGWGPAGYAMPQPFPFPPAGQATYLPAMGAPAPFLPTPSAQAAYPPPPSAQAGVGPSGVAGVSFDPVQAVPAPAVTGGPHPLPVLPQLPIPPGFPNPFEVRNVPANTASASAPPLPPGATAVTGPLGYLPGLGYFGTPGPAGLPFPGPGGAALPPPPHNAFPALPGSSPESQQPSGNGPLPQAGQATWGQVAGVQAAAPPAVPAVPVFQAVPATPEVTALPASPFWLHLAWQLIQSAPVRRLLGDGLERLLGDEVRPRTLTLAAHCLQGAEMQQAFGAMSAGILEQTSFVELFAHRLKAALTAAGVLADE